MGLVSDILYAVIDLLIEAIEGLYVAIDVVNATDIYAIGWIGATLVAYVAALKIAQQAGRHPLLNPVAITAAFVIIGLYATSTTYEDYFSGGRYIHFLLGPATVAMAIPLVTHIGKVRATAFPAVIALVCGSLTAIISAIGITAWLGAGSDTVISMAPKSVTSPIAMGIAEKSGGIPSFTAAVVIATGILGAVIGKQVLDLLGIRDWRIIGFSIGTASHGIGTARAFQINEVAGTFSGIAMGLNGLLTAILVPMLLSFL